MTSDIYFVKEYAAFSMPTYYHWGFKGGTVGNTENPLIKHKEHNKESIMEFEGFVIEKCIELLEYASNFLTTNIENIKEETKYITDNDPSSRSTIVDTAKGNSVYSFKRYGDMSYPAGALKMYFKSYLYYYNDGENFIFSSEIKGILESGLVEALLNEKVIFAVGNIGGDGMKLVDYFKKEGEKLC